MHCFLTIIFIATGTAVPVYRNRGAGIPAPRFQKME